MGGGLLASARGTLTSPWRVAAIGTSELRYVKSGRQVTLTMPRG